MADANSTRDIDFSVDRNNLYREEGITDLKVASIRRLVPIRADGTDDPGRDPIFVASSQLMTPEGPLPLQARLKAKTFAEAMDEFPGAMKIALEETIAQIRNFQQQQQQQQQQQKNESRIYVPR